MGDSLPNFADIGTLEYTGLSDTAVGYSGSSTVQDVTLGSPVLLDSSYGPNDATAVTDFMQVPSIDSTSTQNTITTQQLAGTSDTPFGSMAQSTPTPNVSPPSASTWAGMAALSKLGAGMASLFSASSAKYSAGSQPVTATPAGGILPGGGASGTNTLILVIVVGALIVLLLREEA